MINSKAVIQLVLFTVLAKAANPALAMPGRSELGELQIALSQCESALTALYDSPEQHRIHQRPAVGISADTATFWINSTHSLAGESVELKSRCISELDGDVVSLTVSQGHWR